MATFGLIGKNISYSFSKPFFESYFAKLQLNDEYLNFDLSRVCELENVINQNPNLLGLNVTIPYKEQVMPYLYKLQTEAKVIGAVNTIKITPKGNLIGYNTDAFGFEKSLLEHFPLAEKTALILGTGGASKAVAYVLEKLNFKFAFVSRNGLENGFAYEQLSPELMHEFKLIVNCTPLGTSPKVDVCPKLPYEALNNTHLLFDLVYNPSKTLFLSKGERQGARIVNGYAMLVYQAQRAWQIWTGKKMQQQ